MPKTPSNQSRKPSTTHQEPDSRHPVHSPNWEKRLREAREKREKSLLAQKSGDPTVKDEPAASPAAQTVPTEVVAPEIASPRSHLSKATGLSALLVFSVSAGFGFGIVLGLGVLAGTGGLPVRSPDPAPVQTAALAMPPTKERELPPQANVQAQAQVDVPVPAAMLPELFVEPKLEPGPAVFGVPLENMAPPENDGGQIILPDITPVRDARGTDARSSPTPALFRPDVAATLASDLTFGRPGAETQFFVHVPNGVPDAKLRVFLEKLDASGVKVADIGRENFRVSETHLRFYSPASSEAARSVAADLGVEARDFSKNFIDAQRIEIYIAGRPAPRRVTEDPPKKRFESSTPPYSVSNANR